jgi:hypothetical protein
LAYLVLGEQRERRAIAYLSALITRGHEIDLWAALDEGQERFDELLNADPSAAPEGVDDEEMELRRLLGVA